MSYKEHGLYNEFQQLRYDDKDFAYMWKDTKTDFLEWAMMYEIDKDWAGPTKKETT
jgi:hypothetical protein